MEQPSKILCFRPPKNALEEIECCASDICTFSRILVQRDTCKLTIEILGKMNAIVRSIEFASSVPWLSFSLSSLVSSRLSHDQTLKRIKSVGEKIESSLTLAPEVVAGSRELSALVL